MGKAIELLPGKTEAYLLLEVTQNCHLWLKGENKARIAYIEAAVFGNEHHTNYPAYSAEVTGIFREVLNIPPENCYIRYEDISAWSAAGETIDRRMFR